MAVARALYLGLSRLRRLAGLGDQTTVTRGGIRWALDLAEGIDLVIYFRGRFEPGLAGRLGRLIRPGDVVVDVGANIGAHTLPFARWVGPAGRVLAYEPTAFAYEKLLANLALNPQLAPRVLPVRAILVERSGEPLDGPIYASWPLDGAADVHPEHRGRSKATEGARALSLDDHLAETGVARVNLVKIDVDGAECAVLRGARRTLARHRPIVVMEWAPYLHEALGHDLRACVAPLAELGYRFLDARDGAPLTSDLAGLASTIGVGACINVVGRADRAVA
jgi:FkbM family methyltransferase